MMADQAQPPHDSPTPMSRSAKRRRNEKLYVESDLVRARKERREALRAWKMTESVEERRLLADRLLNAMNQEDEATATRKEELSYISWIDRCTAGDYVASLPITLLPFLHDASDPVGGDDEMSSDPVGGDDKTSNTDAKE